MTTTRPELCQLRRRHRRYVDDPPPGWAYCPGCGSRLRTLYRQLPAVAETETAVAVSV